MLDKIMELKTSKPWLFYILIPVVLVLGVVALLSKLNVSGAAKDIQKAESKDEVLKTEQNKLQGASEQLKKQSDTIEKQIQDNRESDGDADWHKKR